VNYEISIIHNVLEKEKICKYGFTCGLGTEGEEMNIGLLQVDGTEYQGVRFPNLALMKIAGYHESLGDTVEWYQGLLFASFYDKVYASKIFDFSEYPDLPDNAVIGGTGIDFYNKLPPEIESAKLSYSLYPDVPFHVGFSMKGCRFNCSFCCVPKKEGRPKINNSIDELLINPIGGNRLMLMDNDFFGGANWRENLERMIELKLKVCFSQGLNIRIITDEQAILLSKCNYRNVKFKDKYLSFAWDKYNDGKIVLEGIKRCINAGIPATHMQFFILIGYDTTPHQDRERVETLRALGAKPFIMPYNKNDKYQSAFARWVNYRPAFNSCTWEEYQYNPENLRRVG
jgi:hypothetical protein